MKEIKEFIDMMKKKVAKVNGRYDNVASEYNHGAQSLIYSIVTCKEYQALKALLDKPIPRIEVTEEMVEKAMTIALYDGITKCNKELYTHKFKAALKAVFAMQSITNNNQLTLRQEYKKAQQAENKRYTGITDKIALNPKSAVMNESEQKQGEWVKWSGKSQPILGDMHVEVKFRNMNYMDDPTYKTVARGLKWKWENKPLSDVDVVAYRIIPEQTKEICQCPPEERGVGCLNTWREGVYCDRCTKLHPDYISKTKDVKSEPKKQTLLQWMSSQNCGKSNLLTEREQFLFKQLNGYFRYLEQK